MRNIWTAEPLATANMVPDALAFKCVTSSVPSTAVTILRSVFEERTISPPETWNKPFDEGLYAGIVVRNVDRTCALEEVNA